MRFRVVLGRLTASREVLGHTAKPSKPPAGDLLGTDPVQIYWSFKCPNVTGLRLPEGRRLLKVDFGIRSIEVEKAFGTGEYARLGLLPTGSLPPPLLLQVDLRRGRPQVAVLGLVSVETAVPPT